MKKLRTYRIEAPAQPREREGSRTWRGGTRTVKHDGTANVVTWDFRKKRTR